MCAGGGGLVGYCQEQVYYNTHHILPGNPIIIVFGSTVSEKITYILFEPIFFILYFLFSHTKP